MSFLTDVFYIGKIQDKYYIFVQTWKVKEGMEFISLKGEFHTIEDAHLRLIEIAKDQSRILNVKCVEVEKQYMFLKSEFEAEEKEANIDEDN